MKYDVSNQSMVASKESAFKYCYNEADRKQVWTEERVSEERVSEEGKTWRLKTRIQIKSFPPKIPETPNDPKKHQKSKRRKKKKHENKSNEDSDADSESSESSLQSPVSPPKHLRYAYVEERKKRKSLESKNRRLIKKNFEVVDYSSSRLGKKPAY